MTVEEKVDDLRRRKAQSLGGGGPARVEKQHQAGKYTARERIDLLLDPGSFVELDALREHDVHDFGLDKQRFPGDGVVTGWGHVDGRTVYVFAQDFTVLGGSLGGVYAEKICKVMDLAVQNGAPVIGLNDSGGARIQEGVVALGGYAEIFWRNARASGVVPQVIAILGPCAGGAVYSPAITDFILMVEGTSHMFITGPEVIKTVTGESVTMDDLGGAHTHAATSGVAHFAYEDEEACIRGIRELLAYLPSNNLADPPLVEPRDSPARMDERLRALVPDLPDKPYDMAAVVRAVMDDGKFLEVAAEHAKNIVVGFARLNGRPVGVVGNQPNHLAGVLDIDASTKAARFVRFCDAFGISLVTFVDVPGFLPGIGQERGGIIRHGAKLLYAYAEATVPKLTVITRKAYGGAYDVMCSKHVRADFNVAWPTAEIAVMGPEGAVNIVFRKELEGLKGDALAKRRAELVADYRKKFANPYIAAKKGYLDDVIEPQETRPVLVKALEALVNKQAERPRRKHGNIPL